MESHMLKVADAKGRIRRLQMGDCEAIASIYDTAVARGESVYHVPSLTAGDARRLLFDVPPRFEAFIYETECGIAGWAALMRYHERKAYETTAEIAVYVALDQRQKAIGGTLVQQALLRAPELGFHTIVLLLQKKPSYLLAWAAKLGFRSTGYVAAALPVGAERRDILVFQRSVEQRKDLQ
jgi:phosphinothricin acetyltransferase